MVMVVAQVVSMNRRHVIKIVRKKNVRLSVMKALRRVVTREDTKVVLIKSNQMVMNLGHVSPKNHDMLLIVVAEPFLVVMIHLSQNVGLYVDLHRVNVVSE